MSALVAPLRPEFPTSEILVGNAVGGMEWAAMGATANYCNGHGGMLIPWCAIGYPIAAAATETFHFYVAPKARAVERIWALNLRADTAGASAEVTAGGASVVTVYPDTSRRTRTTSIVVREALTAKTSTVADAAIAVKAIGGIVTLESLACYEQTRGVLALDSTDYGVDLTTLRPRQPIAAVANQSAKGVIDAYKNLDARRAGLFAWSAPAADPVRVTDAAYVDLFPLYIPIVAPVLNYGETTTTVGVYLYCKTDGAAADVEITSAGGAHSETINPASAGLTWDGAEEVVVAAEDLAVADGRRSSTWETVRIRARKGASAYIDIAGISIIRYTNPV